MGRTGCGVVLGQWAAKLQRLLAPKWGLSTIFGMHASMDHRNSQISQFIRFPQFYPEIAHYDRAVHAPPPNPWDMKKITCIATFHVLAIHCLSWEKKLLNSQHTLGKVCLKATDGQWLAVKCSRYSLFIRSGFVS